MRLKTLKSLADREKEKKKNLADRNEETLDRWEYRKPLAQFEQERKTWLMERKIDKTWLTGW
jgi:hypothetical protein